jgi:RecT family
MSDSIEPFNPENIPQALEMAKMLATSSIIPSPLKGKPGDIFVVLASGRELGLSPMTALAELYVVEGRPSSSAALKVGLCVSKPSICEYFRLVESTSKKATYTTKRVGSEPVTLSWTIEQAQLAGLAGRNNWKSFPDAMLRARASSALASAVYPDLVKGLVTEDEATDIREERDITPPVATPASVDSVKAKLAKALNGSSPAKPMEIVDEPVPAPAVVDPPPSKSPQERAAALWDKARTVTTKEGFKKWVSDTLQSDKPAAKITAKEMDYLETAYLETIGKPQASVSESRPEEAPF